MDGAGEHSLLRRHRTKISVRPPQTQSTNDPRLTRARQQHRNNMPGTHRDNEVDASSSLFIPHHDEHYGNEQPTQRRRLEQVEGLALPRMAARSARPARYAGDGMDYRRPVMSGVTSAAEAAPVIDLTEEDSTGSRSTRVSTQGFGSGDGVAPRNPHRPPRFGRDIIDIASDEDVHEGWNPTSNPRVMRPHYSGLRRPTRPPSPPAENDDVEFVAERPLSLSRRQTVSRQLSPALPQAPRSFTPFGDDYGSIDLTNDDDVIHLNTRPREGTHGRRHGIEGEFARDGPESHFGLGHILETLRNERQMTEMGGSRLLNRLNATMGWNNEARALHHVHRHGSPRHRTRGTPPRPRDNGRAPHPYQRPMGMPGMLDYGAAAFDIGFGAAPPRPPSPKYSPPPEAEDGFTHSPHQDDILVCPNCGDELAMGESEEKQKVWVVKTCGHAYCGECAQNRLRPVSKKGKGKATDASLPPAFKKCVVEDCGKSASKNAMIPVFLGS